MCTSCRFAAQSGGWRIIFFGLRDIVFPGEFVIQLLTDNKDLADGYAAKLPAAPDGLPPAGERGIVPPLVGQKIGSKYAIG
ncbi:protein of unknown function [Methylococcus capsulatus]|uniref:Uncharacterized protein n=1 Tax=Methylococcus capsulatus TaxID=414 RepID=A0AA35UY68_METCP|nr:protein of unknown function [Methylococcus capsulatus]